MKILILILFSVFASSLSPTKQLEMGEREGVKGPNGENYCPRLKLCSRNSTFCNQKTSENEPQKQEGRKTESR